MPKNYIAPCLIKDILLYGQRVRISSFEAEATGVLIVYSKKADAKKNTPRKFWDLITTIESHTMEGE